MCVSFDPETIYKNAFFASKRENSLLFKSDIVKFCSILEDEVSKNIDQNINYKYVHFDFDKNSLSTFYEAYFGMFNVIGNDIYLSKEIQTKDIYQVNNAYDDFIKKALDSARRIFSDFLNCKITLTAK